MEILKSIMIPVELSDRENLINCVNTSLSSKIINQHTDILSPLAVDSVLRIIDPLNDSNVDLRDIKITKKASGTLEDTELVEGLVFT
jgi:T-complex protein 1 subunit delta